MSVFKARRLLALVGVMLMGLGEGLAQSTDSYVPCDEIPALMQDFNADFAALLRFYTPAASNGGRGAGRGSDPGGSPERRERLVKLYKDYLDSLDKTGFDALPQECKVDYLLFRRDLNDKLAQAEEEGLVYGKVKQWFPFSDKIYDLLKSRRRGLALNPAEVAKDWNGISKQIATLEQQLNEVPDMDKASVDESILVANSLKDAVTSIYDFYNGYDPMFTWWIPTVYKTLGGSLDGYAGAFKKKRTKYVPLDKSGIVGNPIGRDELIKQLRYEMIPYTPEELIDIANKEFAWCDAEMLKASDEMGFGTDWKAAEEKVKNSFVEPGKQPEMILGLYKESIDFLKKNDLITIPPLAEEVWGMTMMSPEAQLTSPFFLGGADIQISYPTNTMEYEDRMMSMRGNNPHFSRATVHHELIAGHNLQGFMNSRNRTYRNFRTPFWTEGWSLYWELLLWDMHFPKSPEDRIGMLFWHMHRCARIIFSLNFHTGKWTPQQCIDFLVERVGFERANAEGEVRRSFEGRYSPLYQLAYLTGGRQFYALHKELVESGKMTNKAFHDRIITLNSMPVEMIRAILTDQKLTKNFSTSWRFYDLN